MGIYKRIKPNRHSVFDFLKYDVVDEKMKMFFNQTILRIIYYSSDQTASSFPEGSLKWNLRPPGKEKIGTEMSPPATSTCS